MAARSARISEPPATVLATKLTSPSPCFLRQSQKPNTRTPSARAPSISAQSGRRILKKMPDHAMLSPELIASATKTAVLAPGVGAASQPSAAEIAARIRITVQIGPNAQSGGFQDGFFSAWYHGLI